ncbi:hypothetical protein MMC07_004048 [Pseudocyphellaria aurata]|nr:hypothetical protein [Pseudocyphellaria aurata]
MVADTQASDLDNATMCPPGPNTDNAVRYVILDNDWGSTAFLPFLIALDADMKVLALASNTCNSWSKQHSLHALALLEVGAFDRCIPVIEGSAYPLVQTEKRVQLWQQLWGKLHYQGVFAPKPSRPVIGKDPTGGDPSQISKSAFIEGFPNTTVLPDSAAHYMIEQVHKHPGKVSIYSAGALTNIAAAIRLDSSFASTAKELVIMGGYVDLNFFQLQSAQAQDWGSDINILTDPEAAHIAVTADFPSIMIVGNVANDQFLTQPMLDQLTSSASNPYAALMKQYNIKRPLWDETAAAVMAYPGIITKSVTAFMDVNVAFDCPDFGRTHLWSKEFAPSHTREVKYVLSINQTAFFEHLEHIFKFPKACP